MLVADLYNSIPNASSPGLPPRAYAARLMTMLQKELKEIERDKASGVTIKVVGSSLQKLIGYVQGTHRMQGIRLYIPLRTKCRPTPVKSCCQSKLYCY